MKTLLSIKKVLRIILFLPFGVCAQEVIVEGVVKTEENETLPGATIQIKGTDTGTITDVNGQYQIKANIGSTLIFSFVGMKKAEFKVTGNKLNVTLLAEYKELEEVVVVSQGYFDVSKEALTGAVVQVGSDKLSQNRSSSIENVLQGQVAGVVVSESAEPGGGVGVLVRGANSMLGGTQPLYVVDGVPINPSEDAQGAGGSGQAQSSLSFLNPNDIEKIEVMKDAAATALYGARGANGVVIITTKNADKSEGKNAFSFTLDQTVSMVNNKLEVLNGPQFEEYMNQRVLNELYVDITNPSRTGIIFDGTQELNATNFPELATFSLPFPTSTGVSSDWQDLTYRTALTRDMNFSYRGGSRDGNLSLSLGYLNNEGVILNSDFNRVTFNLNSSRNVGKKLKLYLKTNVARNWGNASSTGNGEIFQQRGVVSQTLQFQPIFGLLEPGQDDDVYAELNEGNILSNPYSLATFLVDEKQGFNLLQSLSGEYKINANFTTTVKGAFNYQRNTRDIFYPNNTTRGRRNNGEATQSFFDRSNIYVEGNLRYKKNFKKHTLDAIIIGTYEQTNDRRLLNRAFGYGSNRTSYYDFTSATDILVPESNFSDFKLLSGLSRIGYSYQKKYFVDVNARVDASSKFAENQKAAFFPSASLGWIASKEKFLKDVKQISYLKLRTSYGQTGSNPIAPYQSLSLMSPIRYNFDDVLKPGYFESNLKNPNLTWEKTEQYNAGFDLNLFEARIRIVFDAYVKNTRDLLQYVKLPASNGYDQIVDNFGVVQNRGFDLSFGADILSKGKFLWTSTINFSRNRNELVSLNSNLKFQLGPSIGFAQTQPIMFMEGMPLGIFWGAQTAGIYQNWAEANASGIEGAAPGEIIYVNNSIDVDANGVPLPTQLINFDDYIQIGNPNPDFTFAITNNFKYGKWDLSALLTGQKGGDIFWVDSWQVQGLSKATNVLLSAYDQAWRSPFTYNQGDANLVTFNPALDRTAGAGYPAPLITTGSRVIASDRQVFDGSFLRIKNVNLGYTFTMKKGLSLRAYFSGRNLLTSTKFPGYDPEVQAYNKDPQRRGVDFGTYPGVKSYVIGFNFNF